MFNLLTCNLWAGESGSASLRKSSRDFTGGTVFLFSRLVSESVDWANLDSLLSCLSNLAFLHNGLFGSIPSPKQVYKYIHLECDTKINIILGRVITRCSQKLGCLRPICSTVGPYVKHTW